ncbi:hypothetical protein FF38_00364 [Lucilia cuprina]|uniref:Uncharacterized protein n=1 Tax=Lucilia cuprina TaxID=7375 RepID=A0A0L0BSE4_LUCCU|nr:hypothetical protein FF38_00364 [Lucilia cuprina]
MQVDLRKHTAETHFWIPKILDLTTTANPSIILFFNQNPNKYSKDSNQYSYAFLAGQTCERLSQNCLILTIIYVYVHLLIHAVQA